MVRPAHFGSNDETAGSNFFQRSAAGVADAALRALREFDALALALARRRRARASVRRRNASAALPDEVFPNNWLSLHADGTAVLYPLLAANRRRERRPEILAALDRLVRLSNRPRRRSHELEARERVSRRHGQPRARSRAPRRLRVPVAAHARQRACGIRARAPLRGRDRSRPSTPPGARDLPHQRDDVARHALRRALHERDRGPARTPRGCRAARGFGPRAHRSVDGQSSRASPGNLLELRARAARSSHCRRRRCARWPRRRAARSSGYGELVTADIATIEHVGGGSVRCMLAEVALPLKRQSGGA